MRYYFIPQIQEIASTNSLSFDTVFVIAFDYGLIDEYGNLTTELLEHIKGSRK